LVGVPIGTRVVLRLSPGNTISPNNAEGGTATAADSVGTRCQGRYTFRSDGESDLTVYLVPIPGPLQYNKCHTPVTMENDGVVCRNGSQGKDGVRMVPGRISLTVEPDPYPDDFMGRYKHKCISNAIRPGGRSIMTSHCGPAGSLTDILYCIG